MRAPRTTPGAGDGHAQADDRLGRLEQGRAVIYPNQSSGVLRSAAWAEGLVEVLEEHTLVEGDWVGFIPLSEVLG